MKEGGGHDSRSTGRREEKGLGHNGGRVDPALWTDLRTVCVLKMPQVALRIRGKTYAREAADQGCLSSGRKKKKQNGEGGEEEGRKEA